MQTLQNSPEHTQTGHITGKKQVLPLYKLILPFEILILRLPEITTYNSFFENRISTGKRVQPISLTKCITDID
jgi:hypothetical protein